MAYKPKRRINKQISTLPPQNW